MENSRYTTEQIARFLENIKGLVELRMKMFNVG